MTMPPARAVSVAPLAPRLHPVPIRIMHWTNAVVIIIMISSGWKIYNDEVIFGWLHFPEALTLGPYAQHGLQWHFFGMWILVINGIAYVTYGLVTGRFRRMLLPIRLRDLIANIRDALRLKLAHDDPTEYNTVQRILYVGVLAAGVLIVVSGLAIWKPIQFSGLVALFGGFQAARLVHFLCMAAIAGFMTVHVTLALLVPHTLVAMVTGGPTLRGKIPASLPLPPPPAPVTPVEPLAVGTAEPIAEIGGAEPNPKETGTPEIGTPSLDTPATTEKTP
jgi:thiosulfate reductase cytochrome b subunit